jgi:membrane fusion protein, copper/silver efflux system
MTKKRLAAIIMLAVAGFLVGRYSGPRAHNAATVSRKVLYYVDPMHPAYHSSRPGISPDCGMALEPVYEDENLAAKLQLPAGAVGISSERQQLIGVALETAHRTSGTRVIRTTGRVAADESRVHRVMAGTEGWVQSVENYPAGALVKEGQLLATLYSKEFRNAQQAYIGSVTSLDRLKTGRDPVDPVRMGDANLRLNEEQLRALGMGEPQIRDLAKTRQVTRDVNVSSPIDGIVLSRSIAAGQRFENGTEFYRIADLSKVWILADLYDDEARAIIPGSRVKVHVRELSRNLYATVSHDPALFDPASRTLKVRLEADNPGLLLRPDMFIDLEFSSQAPPGISVPQDAVVERGLQKLVYLETSDGIFESRPIETGSAFRDRVIVTHGLSEGDRVVTAGNFLIDSESRMRSSGRVVSSAAQTNAREMSSPKYAKQKMEGASGLHDSRGGDD